MITILALQFIENIPITVQYILFGIEALYIIYKFIYVIRSTKSNVKDMSKLIDKIPDLIYTIKGIFEKTTNKELPTDELEKIKDILEEFEDDTKSNGNGDTE